MTGEVMSALRFDPPGPGAWVQDPVHFPVITSYSIHYTKLYEILAELVPGTKNIAMLGQASNRSLVAVFRSLQQAAEARGISVRLLEATQPQEIDSAFETMAREGFDAFITASALTVLRHRRQIVDLAARYRLLV